MVRDTMNHLIGMRHRQSQWDLENRFTGWKDVDLTPAGEEEARKGGEKIARFRIDHAFSSTLIRARRTIDIALAAADAAGGAVPAVKRGHGWAIATTAALRGRHSGCRVGLNKAETAEQ